MAVSAHDLPVWLSDKLGERWQRKIAFFELLAQLVQFTERVKGAKRRARGAVAFGQNSDSSPTVGAVRKFFSTKEPLCYGLQAFAFHAVKHSAELRVDFLPGQKNTLADRISRRQDHQGVVDELHRCGAVEYTVSLRELLEEVWDRQ